MSDKTYTDPTDEQISDEVTDLLWRLNYYGARIFAGANVPGSAELQEHRDRMAARVAEQLPLRITRMVREQGAQA